MKKSILSFILCLSLVCSSVTLIFAANYTTADESVVLTDKKVYSDISIDDEFAEDRVIVVMDRSVGAINKVHSKSFFGDADISNITDLTQIDLKKVSTQDSRSASDSTVSAEQTAMQINTETFRQNRALGKYTLLFLTKDKFKRRLRPPFFVFAGKYSRPQIVRLNKQVVKSTKYSMFVL